MRLARGSQIVAVWIVLTGCTLIAPPPVAVGPCELRVLKAAGGDAEPIDPPYIVSLSTGSVLADWGQTGILLEGTGWKVVNVTVIGPDGAVRADDTMPGDNINTASKEWKIDEPGVWRFRLNDRAAGCLREFSVEGRPS